MAWSFKEFASIVRVTDGAFGTELAKRGLPCGSVELLNRLNPESVMVVARSFVEAGCDALMTNTLGANRFMLEACGAGDRAAELAEAGVALSKRAAAGTAVKVFASLGPTGKVVMMEEVPTDRLAAAFAETAEALAWGGADAIVIETFGELAEVRIALRAVREATALPVVVSMAFSSGPDKTISMMGNRPAELARLAAGEGADAVGANCGCGPDYCVRLTELLRGACNLPIWVKPNAGLPVLVRGKATFPMGPQEFASYVPKLIGAGASFIGGCCGTTPEHVRAVRQAVDAQAGRGPA